MEVHIAPDSGGTGQMQHGVAAAGSCEDCGTGLN